jgi:phosphomannomutase/phosphoglucomutase
MQIHQEIFRAYDIRGIVDKTLTIEGVFTIGQAIASQALELGEKTIVIGRDGRLSGPRLAKALSDGILSTGCNVVDIAAVATPILYFATHHLNIASGIMITGSHNPSEYNGLKIILKGESLHGEAILNLYHRIQKQDFKHGQGKYSESPIQEAYIQTIKQNVSVARPLKIVVDCGNGIPGDSVPGLYHALGCEVVSLFCEVDGTFPNHHPDPGQPDNLKDLIHAVKQHKADFGLAFDGDGDRLGLIDNEGKIIWPDRQLILFAADVLSRKPQTQIIYDVKCSRHVGEAITALGGEALMWKTGHSLIKSKMKETGAQLAGEMSGHIFFKERWYGFDDALYTGARLIEIVAKQTLTVAELFSTIPDSVNTPELHIKTTEADKFNILKKLTTLARFDDAKISTIDGLRVDFKDGFGLVRCSNTTPNLILRFEGDTENALNRIQNEFRKLLMAVGPLWALPF